MDTVTIPGVELLRAGTWDAITGPEEVTTDDLDAMLAAAGDPDIDAAALRIGHLDRRFDGEPALGWITNLRRVGDRLVGDLTDVPRALAAIMPKAFRRRSVEFARGVKTAGGQVYRAALTGLALLGVAPPAVKGLADVLALYGVEQRVAAGTREHERDSAVELVEGNLSAGLVASVRATTAALAAAVAEDVATEADANAILDHLFATIGVPAATITIPPPATGNNDPQNTPPPRGGTPMDEARIRELLGIEAEADVEAELQRIIDAARAQEGAGNGGAGEGGNGGGTTGTPGTGTPGTGGAGEGGAGGTGEGGGSTGAAGTGGAGGTGTPDLVGAGAGAGGGNANLGGTLPPGTVALSAGQFAELQRQAQAGATALATIEAQERAQIIAFAQREGRISPAEATANFAVGDQAGNGRGAWADYMARPPEELRRFLGGLTPRFSTVELGAGVDLGAAAPGEDKAFDDFVGAVFPELATTNGGN